MKSIPTDEQTLLELQMLYHWDYYDLVKFAVEGKL